MMSPLLRELETFEIVVQRNFLVLLLTLLVGIRITVNAHTNDTDHANNASTAFRNEIYAVNLINNLTTKSDNRVRPGVYGPPTVVKVEMYVHSFGPLNEMQMEFSLDITLRQAWFDPRLEFTGSAPDTPVNIPYHSVEKFWIPDIFFPNEKSGTIHQITVPNKSIRIYPNGTVLHLTRMAMKLSCTMYLANFPLDHQRCLLKISTYSYDERELVLVWADSHPIELHRDEINLPQFDFEGDVGQETCSELYKTGNYSCLAAVFLMRRKVGFFVLQTYIPSILIVMLSWVGFWINKNSEPARVALGVTTVLAMTTQLSTSASNTMRVSYPKALDVWYSACMLFVFGALLEYAFVNAFTRSEIKQDLAASMGSVIDRIDRPDDDVEACRCCVQIKKKNNDTANCPSVVDEENHSLRFGITVPRVDTTSKNIDKISRRMFPIAFIVFNVLYWIMYTVIEEDR